MKLLSGLFGLSLAKSVPLDQTADRDVESLEGIFDEMEINQKLHLDLFEGDILEHPAQLSWLNIVLSNNFVPLLSKSTQ